MQVRRQLSFTLFAFLGQFRCQSVIRLLLDFHHLLLYQLKGITLHLLALLGSLGDLAGALFLGMGDLRGNFLVRLGAQGVGLLLGLLQQRLALLLDFQKQSLAFLFRLLP